jgi:hypothetical protein
VNLKELQARRDVWPVVAARIEEAAATAPYALSQILNHPDLEQHLERKFRKGEAEHNRAWLKHAEDTDWLVREAADEILDFILYQAMILVLHEATSEES